MLFEILSTTSMIGVVGGAYFFQNKNSNDHEKIQKISDTCGLFVRENKDKKGIRLYRKSHKGNYSEYIYKIPLGLSFAQFEEKKQVFVDGLNNKSRPDFNIANLKSIDWKGDVWKQLRYLLNNRVRLDKQIEMEYDGMLRIKVYESGLSNLYKFEESMLEGLESWQVPIGYTIEDLIAHDFEKRPHMIVAGATGFGKSEFIKLLISVLMMNNSQNARFNLIDLKGGSELGIFKNMKQVTNFARDPQRANRILQDIQNDMNKKLDWLFENDLKDVKEAGQKERDFIFIDEAADLDEDSRDLVIDIARRGRSAGYRLIYATQYPTNETLPSQVRANIGARVCFRLETNAQSRAVLDEGGAEELPEIEGRAIFRRVKNHVVQTPFIDRPTINKAIEPHIKIQSKGDGHGSKQSQTTKARGSYTAVFEKA
ncbi:cell division protein FtsK [Halobacillus trueperi]|uniref:Cell division protein FtsK n=1 Tax=Halobacillus trueperi TaxID=156205 RepID=A0A3D8VND6_9BACI|nr:FtsK/SpoIIIE domain-containing protein [Halobacillus trueperi]RDY70338.1 cell division protein FtsK [Halobacillus trueperi]